MMILYCMTTSGAQLVDDSTMTSLKSHTTPHEPESQVDPKAILPISETVHTSIDIPYRMLFMHACTKHVQAFGESEIREPKDTVEQGHKKSPSEKVHN